MKDFNLSDLIGEMPRENTISLVADFGDIENQSLEYEISSEKIIPILPVKSNMLFPATLLPISIGRESSLKLIKESFKKGMPIGVFSQVDDKTSNPDFDGLYHIGVIARIVRIINLPDGSKTALIRGFQRIQLLSLNTDGAYLDGSVEEMPEIYPKKKDREFEAVVESCKDVANKFSHTNEQLIGLMMGMNNIANKVTLINYICANLPIGNDEKFQLIEMTSMFDRAYKLLSLVQREYQFAVLKMNLQLKTRENIDAEQRNYFLRHELENIKEALGDKKSSSDYETLKAKAEKKNWSDATKAVFFRELEKFSKENPQSPDYMVMYNYLDTFVNLPWNEYTKDNLNLNNAKRTLNKDHYGMEKVKERILEHLAVLKMRGDFKSPIICLYGPPGVGKTSLGKSIAKAMNRKYVRVSLGGLHDESEIRGHRRTYVGSMPGRIIKGMLKAESSNPVFILDEIDKVTQAGMHGDPSSALLEVLDPEQNVAFHDNYLDADYDLSKVMFIATANNISNIPTPLLDRMELIEVSGYLTEEKIEIAKRHLLPKALDNVGMADKPIKMTKAAIEKTIEDYTRESGVRTLDKRLNEILRKITFNYALNDELPTNDIKPEDVKKYLGTEPYNRDKYQGNSHCGVVTGLAWTSVGGEILFIETSVNESKAGHLSLTGNLGDVMKESATIALQYLKANAHLLGDVPEKFVVKNEEAKKEGDKEKAEKKFTWTDFFETHNIHIHVPEGATPKDGPSAGITIATSIASALTLRKVRKNIAMTGEITLRGKVLPIGGVKEKILAAKRAGITDIIVCNDNKKNVEDIPAIYVKGVKFHYVDTVEDVLDFALI